MEAGGRNSQRGHRRSPIFLKTMKKKIAVVTGGYSGEATISYLSAGTIISELDREKFDPYYIDVTKEGWFYKPETGDTIPVDKNDFSIVVDGSKVNFDAVLTAMHGTPAEDGKLPGYLDMLGIPYTNCNAATSAITFNKRYTVSVVGAAGIQVAKSSLLFKHEPYRIPTLLAQLALPVFVKPNNGGSSIGMSRVDDPHELEPAIQKAFAEDDQVLVEEFVKGREFTIGVYRANGEVTTLPITEVASKNRFFDFEAKYHGKSEETTPAQVDEAVAQKVRDAAKKIYAVCNCQGVVRIDFIYNEEKGEPFMLEVNTVPGQSAASIVPQQVRAAGLTLRQFYTLLLEECMNK